ncbi:hypothetical protein RUM44_007384 [Polyplax serrata]|uniref:T-cell activation inhibitor, mitochondrial n=1 Tax=Polyplax serrata TaxID=468196 RepID=A0ABR1B0I7_POLSC
MLKCFALRFDSCGSLPILTPFYRSLSSTEVSTALRPFYFSVHPDLFGQFPEERSINENSLKQLSSYLESVQQNRVAKPLTLKFYLRPNTTKTEVRAIKVLKSINIHLRDRSLRKIVVSILKTCDLPTTYVDKVSPKSDVRQKQFHENDINNIYNNLSKQETDFFEDDPIFSDILKRIKKKAKDDNHLSDWLSKNYTTAQGYLQAFEPIRNEIEKLRTNLCDKLKLKRIKWDCGWSISHFKGSLQSLDILLKHHPEDMKSLNGKTLIFGNETGVNLDGDVMLNCGEVRNNWLEVIKNIHRQETVIVKLPQFEKAVSRVLKDIKVVHRKFQPKVTAEKYENQLRRLITSLGDYRGRYGYPRQWPEKLDKYELVVETEAGPLMVSPTGQIIVPSSCPASILVNFISDNLEEAGRLLEEYKSNKYVEKDVHSKVVSEFQLLNLRKDDNITPSLMISCCNRLLDHKDCLRPLLKNSSLFITSYFSLLSDGQMCIPWNWQI